MRMSTVAEPLASVDSPSQVTSNNWIWLMRRSRSAGVVAALWSGSRGYLRALLGTTLAEETGR